MDLVKSRKSYQGGHVTVEQKGHFVDNRFRNEKENEIIFEDVTDEEMEQIEMKMEEIGKSINEMRENLNGTFNKYNKIFGDVANRLKVC